MKYQTPKDRPVFVDNEGKIWDSHICYSTFCKHGRYETLIMEELIVK